MKIKIKISLFMLCLLLSLKTMSQTQQWVFTWNGEGDYSDRYICSATDAQGNVFVGGSTVNIGTDRDYLIQKFNNSGTELWRREYNDAGNGPDEVQAIAVDTLGNVFVTGFGKSADAGDDYMTQKYNAAGVLQWTQTYNDVLSNEYDQANSIAVDHAGNVIVTGQSDADPSAIINDDYLTIKYSSTGSLIWQKRYNGIGDAIDRAVKVVVDGSNNIYVTGRSNNGNDDDYVTIKYNAAGTQQWLMYGDRNHNDRAQAMTIDNAANIYVTGRSSNGTNDDYYTIKYNSSGTELWTKVYDYVDVDRATAIAVDNNGNVYVTGESDGDASAFTNWNISTVKYNSSGIQQWVKNFEGIGANDDVPNAMVIVSNGNIAVTGSSDRDATPVINTDIVVVVYNAGGTLVGSQAFNGAANFIDEGNSICADANGNVFVAGLSENNSQQKNAVLIKYSSTVTQTFANIFDGIGDNSDNIREIKTDGAGNSYAAGYTVSKGLNRNFMLMKVDASGNLAWMRYVDGSSTGSEDEANACEIDNQGNIIVSGFTKNKGTSGDFTIVKYNPNGDSLWIRYYDSPAQNNDKSYSMQLDASGNIYVTGRVDIDPSINSNDDVNTIKYDTNGNQVWVKTYNGSGNGADRGSFIQVASSGNIYVGGRTFNGTDLDFLLIKYNNAGQQQWAKKFDGTFGDDVPTDIKINASEDIYLTGYSAGVTDSSDYLTVKYDASGTLLWNKRFNNANGGDVAQSIALKSDGTCIVTGYSDADASATVNLDQVSIAYDAGGNQQWINLNPTAKDEIGDAVLVNNAQHTFFASHLDAGNFPVANFNISLTGYDSLTTPFWNAAYNNAATDSFDVPNVLWSADSSLYVGGSTWQTNNQRDVLIIKYSGFFVGTPDLLNGNFDVAVQNPFCNYLSVNISGNNHSDFSLKLFDVAGKFISETQLPSNGAYRVSIPTLSSGIYFAEIKSENSGSKFFKLFHSNF